MRPPLLHTVTTDEVLNVIIQKAPETVIHLKLDEEQPSSVAKICKRGRWAENAPKFDLSNACTSNAP